MTDVTDRLSTALAGRYRLERHLGEGGMATVYLAHDVKHDRKVAVKVLRPELAAVLGHDRFVQEIRTTANLQHPHILPLFDSGESDSFLYYVMPFVEGETLRDKLTRETQLGIDEAVRIASEVADALDYAHRHGVIHRDIKPENILLHDGRPMVADFGIALAVSAAAGGRMTETGLSLGTPHYMSPEQATAEKELTPRSDVYSLGCVLFEMLSGEPPHTGATAQAIVMKIVMDRARPVTDLRQTVPAHVAAATARALEKLPADRFTSAKAFADALANPGFALAPTGASARPGAPVGRTGTPRGTVAAGTFAGVMTLAALWGWFRPAPDPPSPVVRYRLDLTQLLTGQGQFGVSLALSSDGSQLVYVGPAAEGAESQLWIRARHELKPTSLVGSQGAHQPFFAPDGRRVAFINATGPRAIRVVSLGGEPPITLVDSGAFRLGGAWGEDGYLYFSMLPHGGLGRVPATGGPIQVISRPDSAKKEMRHAWPDALPSGKGVLVTIQRGNNEVTPEDDIAVVDLATGQARVLVRGLLGRYATTGHLVFVRFDGAVMAVPFDQEKLAVTGSAVPVFGGVSAGVRGPDFTLSRSGRLVYMSGSAVQDPEAEVVWVDRAGRTTPFEAGWTMRPDLQAGPVLSPDGSRLALGITTAASVDIWIKPARGGTIQRLTFEGNINVRPRWTADGRSVTFLSNRASPTPDLSMKRADGSGPTTVVAGFEQGIAEGFVTADGRWAITRSNNRLQRLRLGVDSLPSDFLASDRFGHQAARLSPDGRWIAYAANESGTGEVYVKPYPNVDAGRWQVSTAGGTEPVWSPSGRELFYKSQGRLMAAKITTAPTFSVGEQTPLFTLPSGIPAVGVATYDVSRDGLRFLMYRLIGAQGAVGGPEMIVVENWTEELKARFAETK